MKRTLSQMQEICQRWEQSGLSRRIFCEQNNIAHQTFNYWYKRIASKENAGFAEVPLPGGVAAGKKVAVEVIFPSGARITFEGEPSVQWLKELVR
jgi:hypothetical protein